MGVDLLNIAGLKELEHQRPVVMVNLMRVSRAFARWRRLGLGRLSALQRADGADDQGARRHAVVDRDAKAVALGDPEHQQWDYLALVYYPSVAAFTEMMTSSDYETRCDPIAPTAARSM